MKYYAYIYQNLRNFSRNHKGMFFLMAVSEIIAVICLMFSYGLFLQSRESSGELKDDQRTFSYDFCSLDENGNTDYSTAQTQMNAKINKLISFLGEDFDSLTLYLRVADKTGELHSATVYYPDNGNFSSTENSSEKQYICNMNSELNSKLTNDKSIELDGISYMVNEVNEYNCDFIMPLYSLSDSANGISMIFMLKEQPSKEKIELIEKGCYDIFGVDSSAVPEASQLLEVQINNMFYLYAVIITLIVIIDLSLYFKYIFKTRKKEMYIFKICGATASKISEIFILEILSEIILGFAIGAGLFKSIGINIATRFYPNFPKYYSSSVCSNIFIIYILVSLAIITMITVPYVNKLLNSKNAR